MKPSENLNSKVCRTESLGRLVDELGVHDAWVSVLASHVVRRAELAYIAEDGQFSRATVVEDDLIRGLSVGEVGVLYEYSVARVNRSGRKRRGQFFTPDDAARFLVAQTKRFPAGVWHDPCCGVGNLAWHLVDSQDDPEEFLTARMTFADTDPLALLIARVLLVSSFQRSRPSLFHDIEGKFVVADFLTDEPHSPRPPRPTVEGGAEVCVSASASEGGEGLHLRNFIIMNPPYVAVERNDKFVSARAKDLYAYFLERATLTSDGFVAVVPQSFTHAEKFRELRRVLLTSNTHMTVYTFDNVPGNFFKGFKFGSINTNTTNSVRAAVVVSVPLATQNEPEVVGSPEPGGEPREVVAGAELAPVRRITSLLRWRGVERDKIFSEADTFLSEPEFSEHFFPKVGSPLAGLYRDTRQWGTLSHLTHHNNTPSVLDASDTHDTHEVFPLFIPSIPRYFISALKTPATRTSQRTIHFGDETTRDKAYLLLNSSLTYWWWRVRDGGMTLSLTALLSVPVPRFNVDADLVKKLEKSEHDNRVYKKNAGKIQENVKHPLDLIDQINKVVIPAYANTLLTTHENSVFVNPHTP